MTCKVARQLYVKNGKKILLRYLMSTHWIVLSSDVIVMRRKESIRSPKCSHIVLPEMRFRIAHHTCDTFLFLRKKKTHISRHLYPGVPVLPYTSMESVIL